MIEQSRSEVTREGFIWRDGGIEYIERRETMTRSRTRLVAIVILLLFFRTAVIEAYEVAVIKSAEFKPYNDALEGFRSTCACDIRELTHEDHEETVGKIYRMRPDAVFAIGLDSLKLAESVRNMPVFFAMVLHPPSRDQGQRKMSGVTMSVPFGKQLDAILEIFPNARKVGLVYDPGNPDFSVTEALNTARSKKIELIVKKAQKPGEVLSLIDGMKNEIDVFLMLPDKTLVSPETFSSMLIFSFQNRIPIFSFSKKYVEMGAVAALAIDPFDLGAQVGEMTRRAVSEGRNDHADVPPRKTTITINRKVAKKLGIKIRDDVLERAEIIN